MAEPRTPQDRIDDDSAALDDLDHRQLARVERALKRGRALRQWWLEKSGAFAEEYDGQKLAEIVDSGIHADCFHVLRELPHWEGGTEANYAFFDEAPIDGGRSWDSSTRPSAGLRRAGIPPPS